jgi:hypothetical protein
MTRRPSDSNAQVHLVASSVSKHALRVSDFNTDLLYSLRNPPHGWCATSYLCAHIRPHMTVTGIGGKGGWAWIL